MRPRTWSPLFPRTHTGRDPSSHLDWKKTNLLSHAQKTVTEMGTVARVCVYAKRVLSGLRVLLSGALTTATEKDTVELMVSVSVWRDTGVRTVGSQPALTAVTSRVTAMEECVSVILGMEERLASMRFALPCAPTMGSVTAASVCAIPAGQDWTVRKKPVQRIVEKEACVKRVSVNAYMAGMVMIALFWIVHKIAMVKVCV